MYILSYDIYIVLWKINIHLLFFPFEINTALIFILWMVGFILWHINLCWLFNAKSCLYIYIEYMIC